PPVIATTEPPPPKATAGRLPPISPGLPPRSTVSPEPSWPDELSPQPFIVPLSNQAHSCPKPPATVTTVRPAPRATAGRLSPISPAPSPRLARSPKPSCPKALYPQHFNVAAFNTAQVCSYPATTAAALRPVPNW